MMVTLIIAGLYGYIAYKMAFKAVQTQRLLDIALTVIAVIVATGHALAIAVVIVPWFLTQVLWPLL